VNHIHLGKIKVIIICLKASLKVVTLPDSKNLYLPILIRISKNSNRHKLRSSFPSCSFPSSTFVATYAIYKSTNLKFSSKASAKTQKFTRSGWLIEGKLYPFATIDKNTSLHCKKYFWAICLTFLISS